MGFFLLYSSNEDVTFLCDRIVHPVITFYVEINRIGVDQFPGVRYCVPFLLQNRLVFNLHSRIQGDSTSG